MAENKKTSQFNDVGTIGNDYVIPIGDPDTNTQYKAVWSTFLPKISNEAHVVADVAAMKAIKTDAPNRAPAMCYVTGEKGQLEGVPAGLFIYDNAVKLDDIDAVNQDVLYMKPDDKLSSENGVWQRLIFGAAYFGWWNPAEDGLTDVSAKLKAMYDTGAGTYIFRNDTTDRTYLIASSVNNAHGINKTTGGNRDVRFKTTANVTQFTTPNALEQDIISPEIIFTGFFEFEHTNTGGSSGFLTLQGNTKKAVFTGCEFILPAAATWDLVGSVGAADGEGNRYQFNLCTIGASGDTANLVTLDLGETLELNYNTINITAAANTDSGSVYNIIAVGNTYDAASDEKRSENSGAFEDDGGGTDFTIAHGLLQTPNVWSVVAESADADGDFYATADGTNITVTYASATTGGTNNVKLRWWAKV